jgi:UDPglucose 6-dehydrogenase
VNVCVFGLWHLGAVTAACLASGGHEVVGLDSDIDVVERLREGTPPIFEPDLEPLTKQELAAGHLRFTHDPRAALGAAEVVWITVDTPVDDDDRADVESVVAGSAKLFPYLHHDALVIVSSQVPVGTTRRLQQLFDADRAGRRASVAYIPENLRLGRAIDAFTRPDRVVAGVNSDLARTRIAELLRPFTTRIEWMSIESAEMTKHALNAFLATSVTFANEIAAICEQVGADASEVERGLKSDGRIGPGAYLSPGGAFSGGTLARDLTFLTELGDARAVATDLLSAVKTSNDAHRHWANRRLTDLLGSINGKTIGVWGLTYKPGTDTLRRSAAIELCRWLAREGAAVRAHDQAVRQLPTDMPPTVSLTASALAAAAGADALVVATAWPDYRSVAGADVAATMRGRVILDAGGFLASTLGREPSLRYFRVGTSAT